MTKIEAEILKMFQLKEVIFQWIHRRILRDILRTDTNTTQISKKKLIDISEKSFDVTRLSK